MERLLRLALLIGLALLVPVLPFLGFGEALEEWIKGRLEAGHSAVAAATLIAAILTTDVFLPIPSSFVSTFGGMQLGAVLGTAASWVGMTCGAMLGYALARGLGRPLVVRLAGEEDLRRLEALSSRFGPEVLVLTRALPIVAEAAVLLLGAMRLGWWRFFAAVSLSNLGIAAVYSAFGAYARQHDAVLAALVASIALPLAAALLARRLLPAKVSSL